VDVGEVVARRQWIELERARGTAEAGGGLRPDSVRRRT
jgi:hypothetical protein